MDNSGKVNFVLADLLNNQDRQVLLEPDGSWCSMAHANQKVTSFQACPPLMQVGKTQKIVAPNVSPQAAHSLGAFTGDTMAVCTYASPRYPALVAYDYQNGSLRWTSSLSDLPGDFRRKVSAILLARMYFPNGQFRRAVFAANPLEFVAYNEQGGQIWKQQVVQMHPNHRKIGAPVSLTFNETGELITVTDEGWIIKLRPQDGSLLDAYQLTARIVYGGKGVPGTLASYKSVIVVGNILYLAVEFKTNRNSLEPARSPVYLLRIDLGAGGKIQPLTQTGSGSEEPPDRVAIGVNIAGGSPSAFVSPDGKVLLFANSEVYTHGQFRPVITVIEDDNGVLRKRWWSILNVRPGEVIYAAPALHEASRTLLVNTPGGIFVFRDVDALEGGLPSPLPLAGVDLIPFSSGQGVARVRMGSPFALAFNAETEEIVAYTNLRMIDSLNLRTYGFLGAFALRACGRLTPRPLWCRPLAITPSGDPAPGPGTFGQPALFRYTSETGDATGIIVNTVRTGTYIFK